MINFYKILEAQDFNRLLKSELNRAFGDNNYGKYINIPMDRFNSSKLKEQIITPHFVERFNERLKIWPYTPDSTLVWLMGAFKQKKTFKSRDTTYVTRIKLQGNTSRKQHFNVVWALNGEDTIVLITIYRHMRKMDAVDLLYKHYKTTQSNDYCHGWPEAKDSSAIDEWRD